jgi:hypothetical protein
MKRLIIAIPVILLCSFFACKKVKGPANGNSVQPNNHLDSTVAVSASINGAPWQTDSAFGYSIKYSGNDSGVSNLMITATNYRNHPATTMTFNITNYSGLNVYPVNPPFNTAAYYVGNIRYFATKGTITVTSDTAYALKGTFSFTADTLTISSGVFNVAIP